MTYVYLLQCPYFKNDVFKIGGSEKNGNERLKSYGKGTTILAMIVINCDYREVENKIKKSFNHKFTLIHGNEYFQGNKDEIKLEFLKTVYNNEINSRKMLVNTESKNDNEVIESKNDNEVIESKNDTEVIESKNDNEVIESKNDNEVIESKNDNEVIESKNDKLCICNYCNKTYSNKSNLIKHQKSKSCFQKQNIKQNIKQIQELKENNIKLQTLLKNSENEELSKNIKLQTRLKNSKKDSKNINQLQVLDLNEEEISKIAFRHFSLDYLKQENKGVATFTINHVIRDSNGKPNYVCTDPSRKIAKYKSADDNIVTDFGMTILSDTVYKSIKNAVQSLVMKNILEEGTSRDDNRYYKHEKKLNKNSPDFTNEIAKAVYSKNVL